MAPWGFADDSPPPIDVLELWLSTITKGQHDFFRKDYVYVAVVHNDDMYVIDEEEFFANLPSSGPKKKTKLMNQTAALTMASFKPINQQEVD